MKIAIIGYGKMGTLIERIALERQHQVVSVDPYVDNANFKLLNSQSLDEVDVCIDFTRPDTVLKNIATTAELGKNIVVGSTGWYDKIDEVRATVENSDIGLLYASNFSIGVQLFFRMLKQASHLMNAWEDYDVSGFEAHHNQKADSPSGTAHTMAHLVKDALDRKTEVVFGSPDRRIEDHELQVASMRCGQIPGTHEICFDSLADSISLKHTARTRSGFALGAVQAAEWLHKKQGFYTIDDMMNDVIKT